MKLMKKISLMIVLTIFFTGPYLAFSQEKIDLKMMTGPMGGSWYPFGGAIADSIQKEIPNVMVTVSPGGGIANVEALELGKCDIGFSMASSVVDALYGRSPFKQKMENMRQLATLYPQYFQMVVWEESPIKSVADMKGKALSCDRKGLLGELLAEKVLQVYGLSYKDMAKVHHVSYSDGVSLMKDGHAQGIFMITTIPASSILDLAHSKRIRMLSLPEDKIKEMQKLNAGYLRRDIPKGTYPGVDYEVHGVGTFTNLIISAKLPESLVHKITKILSENVERFSHVVKDMKGVTAKDLALDIGIPFHPGALKYYKEVGAIK